jgi:hypothetical protein
MSIEIKFAFYELSDPQVAVSLLGTVRMRPTAGNHDFAIRNKFRTNHRAAAARTNGNHNDRRHH